MRLAIFDFDGTITNTDSFIDFLLHTHGPAKTLFSAVVLSPLIVMYALKLYPREKLKNMTLTLFYAGTEEAALQKLAAEFATESIPKMVRPSALEKPTAIDHRRLAL